MTSDVATGNGTGLQTASGGTIVSLGANNTVFGNTVNGSASSTVSTGAVGPAGATGATGAAGSSGPAGLPGARGPAGNIELVTCKAVTTTKRINGKRRKVTTRSCTGKSVSGSVTFKAARAPGARASLTRDGVVYATGRIDLRSAGSTDILRRVRVMRPGRYTLILWNGHAIGSRSVVLVR